MKTSRKLLIVLGAVVGLFVVLALALPLFIDVNVYHDVIEGRAEDALGRDVRLGKMKLSLLPFGVRVNDIAVAALPGEGEGDLLTAESVRVGARLMPLLSKRLEITGIVVERPSIVLLRDASGEWNVQRLLAAGPEDVPPAEGQAGLEGFAIDSLRITGGTVSLRDSALNPGREFATELREIDLRIRGLAVDRRMRIELSTALDAVPGATMAFEGEVGPLVPAAGEPFRITGTIRLDDVDSDALAALLVDAGLLDTMPERFFAGREVDLSGRVDATWSATETGIPYVGLSTLELDLDGTALAVKGGVWGEGPVYDVDLEMLPSRIKAEHITSLLALVIGQVPVAFASDKPVEIEAKVRGRVGDGGIPEVAGTAKLSDFTFEHPGLAQPVERLHATISIGPGRLDVSDFGAVIGSSDASGELSMIGFERPRVTFGLRSKRADFFELFSFLESSSEEGPSSPEDDAAGEELARSLTVDGNLEIEEGSFQTLDFTRLSARMRWADGVLTLDPFDMSLYDGTFGGSLTYRPFAEPSRFDLRGEAAAVDVAAILRDNMEIEDLVSGKFSGTVSGNGSGADYDSIVRSLDAGGSFTIESGHVGGLDVLGSLSKVTGIFGEQTLSSLSGQLGEEGTEFSRATGEIRVRNATMQLTKLRIEAPDFSLVGKGDVSLLDERLEGNLEIVFSEAASNSMKEEGSRAGAVFWNPDTERVQFPFTLSGPYTAPSAMVDWKGTLGTVAKRRAKQELQGLLQQKLGMDQEPASPQPDTAAGGAAATGPAVSPAGPGGLAAEITGTRWSSSLLLKDLKLSGTVRGEAIDHASLEVTDAAGEVLMRSEAMKDVGRYLSELADRGAHQEIPWKAKVDGERIATARMPLTVTVKVFNTSGESAEISRQVR